MLGRHNARNASPNSGGRAALGFRRITLVRAWTDPPVTRFEVDGVVHRYPVTRPVTAAMAARLVASGVPLVVRSGPVERAEVPSC